MTADQIDKALDRYIAIFKAKFYEPVRHPGGNPNPTLMQALQHCYWMAVETKKFSHDHTDKAMRWLCFIQGTLWSIYGFTIDEFRDDNR